MKSLPRSFACVLFLLWVFFPFCAANAAPPNCSETRGSTEKVVCSNSALGTLDRELSEAIEVFKTKNQKRPRSLKVLEVEQEKWRLNQRDKCGNDSACIALAYQRNIDRVDNWLDCRGNPGRR